MFAARDQENLAHAHRQAAASKPLNQSVPPKTPGPIGLRSNLNGRHTSKKPLNDDENNPFVAKGGNINLGKEKNAFVTPGPRDRAPLGAKTTNAKAKPFQTPAPLTKDQKGLAKTQPRSASTRKPKLKVHQQLEPVFDVGPVGDKQDIEQEEDDVPDIEYAPPRPKDLPDYPDPEDPFEFKPDEEFPMFSRENYMRGALEYFGNPVGADGLTRRERKAKEEAEADEQYFEQVETQMKLNPMELDMEREWRLEREAQGAEAKKGSIQNHKPSKLNPHKPFSQRKSPQNAISSQIAAAALSSHSSNEPRAPSISRFAAPTASSAAKKPSTTAPIIATKHANTLGSIASKSTIGYSQGRKVSASRKQQQEQSAATLGLDDDQAFVQQRKAERGRADRLLEQLLAEDRMKKEGEDEDPLSFIVGGGGIGVNFDLLDEDYKDFQLEMPAFAGET